MDKKKFSKEEEMAKFEEQIKEVESMSELEAHVVENAIEFEVKEKKFRVRMPTVREKMQINRMRLMEARKLQIDGFLYEAELIKDLYEKQGIDIEQLDKEIINDNKEIEKLQMKLAPEVNKEHRERLKKLIVELEMDKMYKIAKKNDYLETSMESQLTEIMITHFASLIFEVMNGENWERVFKSYDAYIDCTDSFLVAAAINYTHKLLF